MKKSFSLMLAWRYLNPRRAWISIITMISVLGVLLGVMVLVVVMAVYSGLERDQKKRLLGFSPHILLQYSENLSTLTTINDWGPMVDRMEAIPGIQSAYPHIEDNAMLDSNNDQRPVTYQAVETNDERQMEGIIKILDHENYLGSTADLGLDDRVVVSSLLADQFRWKLGDKINLYSTRNFREVLKAYKSTENLLVRDRFPEQITALKKLLREEWKETPDGYTISRAQANVINALYDIYELTDLRPVEKDSLQALLELFDQASHDPAKDTFHFDQGAQVELDQHLTALLENQQDKIDADVLKGIKGLVLPREAEIVGVYQASMMVKMPDIFMPMSMAQGLSGLGEGVQGIALRIDDAYRADKFVAKILPQLDQNWFLTTWSEQYASFFAIINQQRVMMYFVLSLIVLISAFSMMAVMFTVTIQKKKEIGVMKALGATPGQITCVFLYQGTILGFAGSLLGVLLGNLIIYFRGGIQELFRHAGFDPFSKVTGSNVLPAHMDFREQFFIALMGLILCVFASFVPAFFASRSDAAKSLRNL